MPPLKALAPPELANPTVSFQHPTYVYPAALARAVALGAAVVGLTIDASWARTNVAIKAKKRSVVQGADIAIANGFFARLQELHKGREGGRWDEHVSAVSKHRDPDLGVLLTRTSAKVPLGLGWAILGMLCQSSTTTSLDGDT